MEQMKTLADLSLHLQHPTGASRCLPMLLESHFSAAQGRQSLPQKCCRTASIQPFLQKDVSPLLQVVMSSARQVLAGCPVWTLDLTHYLTFSDITCR